MSSDYAPVTIVGQQSTEAMNPWITTQLAWYLDAIGEMFEQTASLAYDSGEDNSVAFVPGSGYVVDPFVAGYGKIFDPDTCPDEQLPYLGQFAGVEVPAGTDPVVARSLVGAEAGLARGTDGAITTAITRNLTGTKAYTYLPRLRPDGVNDPYWFMVVVRTSECPDSSALIASVNAVKPGGVLWLLVLTDGYTWSQAIHTWSQDTMSWAQTSNTQP